MKTKEFPKPSILTNIVDSTMVQSFIVHVIYIRRSYLSLQIDIVPLELLTHALKLFLCTHLHTH